MKETNEKKEVENNMSYMGNEKEGKLEKLDSYLKNMVDITYQIHDMCYEKLQEFYGQDKIVLPIKIEVVADKMGIKFEYGSLDFGMSDKINQEIAQLRIEEEGEERELKIIVDNTFTRKLNGELSNLEKYAVAYELGKVIINKIDKGKINDIYDFNMDSMEAVNFSVSLSKKDFLI